MNFLIANWFLVVAAFVSGGMLLWPMLTQPGGAGSVSVSEAVRLINRERGIVIDVSEPAEYAAAHVAGSRSIPLASLEGAKNLPTNKNLPLILVCPNGSRAGKAVASLKKLGYANVQSIAGGLAGWRAANLPVEKAIEKIDRNDKPDKADKAIEKA